MKKKSSKKISKFVYWTPRIASIVFIVFLTLFSLDVFGMGLGFWGTLLAFIMHSVPSIILTIALLISWKYEIVGGIGFALGGLLYIGMIIFNSAFEWYMLAWAVQIAGPAFFISVLFFMNWFKKRK
jgi:hypothetical protein